MADAAALGDAFAWPLFGALALYFLAKPSRSTFEQVLLAFAVVGFAADFLFTLQRLNNHELLA